MAMVSSSPVVAQEATELPPLPVEGAQAKKAKPKKAAVNAAPPPEPAPAPPAEEPVLTQAERERIQQDIPYQTPASVSTVTIGGIRTFGQVDTGDVLRALPGTSTRSSPNNPGVAVNIRGFEGSGRVNMMIDGVRQNFRFTGHEAQGFTYVDPALLAGIDIQRGAVSTVGGAGALAGTANFRTLDVSDIIKPGQSAGAITSVTWGTNNQGWSEMAAGGVTNGGVGIAGAISKREPGNYENGDGIIVPYTEEDLRSGLVKAEFQLNEEQKLKFGAVIYDNAFLSNSYFQNLRTETFTLNYTYNPISTDLVHLKVNAYQTNTRMHYLFDFDPLNGAPLFPGGPLSPPLGTAAGRVIDDDGKGFDVSNLSLFSLGAVKVKSINGYEFFEDDVNVINSTTTPGRGVNPSGKSSIEGAFSETTFSYSVVDLIAGLRYDRFKLEGEGSVAAGNPVGLPAGPYALDREEGRFNPKVTLAATPLAWFQPYVTYSESMRAPTVNETLTGGQHPAFGPPQQFFPNPFLDPEIQKGWEFGFNVRYDGLAVSQDRFRLKADYYTQDVENYIIGVSNPATGASVFVNVPGTSQVQGIEVESTYDARFLFAGVAYTYTDSDLPSQTNGFGAQSFLPDHVLTLTGGLRFFNEKLETGARWHSVSESFIGLVNVAAGQSPYVEPYDLLDLFASYKMDSGLDLGFTMTNVFDKAYTPELTTPATNFTGELGRGRTALFTARAHF